MRPIIGPWVKLCKWNIALRTQQSIRIIGPWLTIANDEPKKTKKWSQRWCHCVFQLSDQYWQIDSWKQVQ